MDAVQEEESDEESGDDNAGFLVNKDPFLFTEAKRFEEEILRLVISKTKLIL
jgi:hypothetical protein